MFVYPDALYRGLSRINKTNAGNPFYPDVSQSEPRYFFGRILFEFAFLFTIRRYELTNHLLFFFYSCSYNLLQF